MVTKTAELLHLSLALQARRDGNVWAAAAREDGEGGFQVRGSAAQHGNTARVFFVRAVRKIQTRDIHPGAQQFFDQARRAARGADGANDFRVPVTHGLPW